MRRTRTASGKRSAGFSLIEVILVITLIGVLAVILIPPLEQGVDSYVATETRGDLASEARQAATRVARELRNIQKKATNAPNISSANATSITFVDVFDSTITFALSGSTVQRNANTLADLVSSFQFRYFNGNNGELTPPLSDANRDSVRRILFTLTLADGGQTVAVTEQVFLRDLSGL